jgi:NAD+ synthase (glutamine-hydrolysing)
LLCVLNASPFHLDKADEREARMAERARSRGAAAAVCHLVGGQDEVVFDGASFAVDAAGPRRARAPSFEPALRLCFVRCRRQRRGPLHARAFGRGPGLAALVTGVRDYLGKNGFPGAIIGLSGASTRRWCWRWPSTRWAPTACAR